jgi:hypothetical protein
MVLPVSGSYTSARVFAFGFLKAPLRGTPLPFATLATIRPGVELITCIAPPFLAFFCASHGGTRHTQRINKQPGKPGTQPVAERENVTLALNIVGCSIALTLIALINVAALSHSPLALC